MHFGKMSWTNLPWSCADRQSLKSRAVNTDAAARQRGGGAAGSCTNQVCGLGHAPYVP